MSVNKVILVGNVGRDPETRYLEGGTAFSKFPLATSEVYKNREGEKVTTTDWHNIVLWRGLAEIAEKYVKKGSQLYIEGRIKTRSYVDQDGNTKYITEIVGDVLQMLGKKPEEVIHPPEPPGTSTAKSPVSNTSKPHEPMNNGDTFDDYPQSGDTDDLPF